MINPQLVLIIHDMSIILNLHLIRRKVLPGCVKVMLMSHIYGVVGQHVDVRSVVGNNSDIALQSKFMRSLSYTGATAVGSLPGAVSIVSWNMTRA